MKIFIATILTYLLSFAPQQGTPEVKRLTAEAYKEQHARQKGAVLLDVRTPAEYTKGHLKKAKNVDFLAGEVDSAMHTWNKSDTYYIYCATGNRSGKAAKLLQEAGFEHVYNIGGYEDLEKAGIATRKEKKHKGE
ncbi:rhodanese-like domain-containing protein [Pontibacter sp. SGAir0037]|uniref:rhodanese-like domain-containing protein n=1 Tax=Pontibacter sp. SGAir0037 TaxID=2571030 RepID=UPI0010CD0EF7|nr:rhodanese-like domain-containing protein [Pontibacter sp. SGAir0037]QCR21285.1 rhodanese-like domain-containing protein [Pontibacter sp. SGAir0037]